MKGGRPMTLYHSQTPVPKALWAILETGIPKDESEEEVTKQEPTMRQQHLVFTSVDRT